LKNLTGKLKVFKHNKDIIYKMDINQVKKDCEKLNIKFNEDEVSCKKKIRLLEKLTEYKSPSVILNTKGDKLDQEYIFGEFPIWDELLELFKIDINKYELWLLHNWINNHNEEISREGAGGECIYQMRKIQHFYTNELRPYLQSLMGGLDIKEITQDNSSIETHNIVEHTDMKTFKQMNFDNIYDRTFGDYINHPTCQLSNKYKHKIDWRKKILSPVCIRNNKPDYFSIAFQRIMELEMELNHLRSTCAPIH